MCDRIFPNKASRLIMPYNPGRSVRCGCRRIWNHKGLLGAELVSDSLSIVSSHQARFGGRKHFFVQERGPSWRRTSALHQVTLLLMTSQS